MNKLNDNQREIVYIEQTEKFHNKVQIFEDRVKKNSLLKEEEEERQRLYEKNRANMRERMRRLKEFIRDKKDISKTDEEFFEQYKKYFAQYNVKSYLELQKLINNFDEMERKEKYLKYLKIIKIEDFFIKPEIKRFDNLNIDLNSKKNNIYINKYSNYFKKLQKSNNIITYNLIPNIKEYIYNKISTYEIKRLDNKEVKGIKKYKYNNESELIESSNTCSIQCEKISNNIVCAGENYTENGIPIQELRNKKIKKIINGFSEEDKENYKKVDYIMKNIRNKYDNNINNKNIFCLDCNECFSKNEKDEHSNHSTFHIEDDKDDLLDMDINELDYNINLNKLYEKLKKDQNKILIYGNNELIIYYGELLFSLYEIIINNNSIEELNKSIININDNYKEEIESKNFNQFFKDYFLFNIKRIEKLSYFKKSKIEKILADLDEENNYLLKNINYQIENNNNFENNKIKKIYDINLDNIFYEEKNKNLKLKKNDFNKLNEDDKKKLFLKIGLGLKYKYGKNESITELYSKAKNEEIIPLKYEDFIMKNLNIPKVN